MIKIREHLDIALVVLSIGGFVLVASQRLGQVPLPDSDEAMTLQVPYEMLNRGKLAFPMYQFLGGNIENVWHSFTPVYFVTLAGFMKVLGWGLLQGRAFNLATTVLLLTAVYLVARRLSGRLGGVVAVVLLISDPLFLTRSRLARNDMLASAFGLLAFYLFHRSEDRQRKWGYLASGLAAGAGVMCHTNLLCVLAVIAALMTLTHGWKVVTLAKPYLFSAGALLVMAYEIAYDILDYPNFAAQNRRDDLHFRVLENWGWWQNLLAEPARYLQWWEARGARIAVDPLLVRVFLTLSAIALVYLATRFVLRLRRRTMSDSRSQILVATVIVVLFFAAVTQRKVTQYTVILAPWFAICVAVMLRDAVRQVRDFGRLRNSWARPAYGLALVTSLVAVAAYGYALARQTGNYLSELRDPDQPSFEELKEAVRSIVPDGVCPASIASGYFWLAFPEHDRCYFAHMEARLDEPLELLEGGEYALIVKPKFEERLRKLTGAGFERYHLIGELRQTAYGTFEVYYTGNDSRLLALAPKRFYFFGRRRGYVSDQQIANSQEVWTREGLEPSAESTILESDEPTDADQADKPLAQEAEFVSLCSVELDPHTVYQVVAEFDNRGGQELAVLDEQSGARIGAVETASPRDSNRIEELFRTSRAGSIRLAIRAVAAGQQTRLARVSIRRVAAVQDTISTAVGSSH
jgi:4-amino-4-deoxy-L-arabinose transferase-like glycosyltransferase